MTPDPPLFVASILAFAASPAFAQHPWEQAATVEQAIARAVADAIPDVRYPSRLEWSNFGIRGGRDIFWHLAPPVQVTLNAPPPMTHRRTGWLNISGRSGDVAVCGDDERISGIAISMADIWLGQSDVISELVEKGVTATLIESREAVTGPGAGSAGDHYLAEITRYPALRRWHIKRDGHEPAELTAVFSCTPPGTRSATSCRMTWTALFRPDEPRPGLDVCLYGSRPSYMSVLIED